MKTIAYMLLIIAVFAGISVGAAKTINVGDGQEYSTVAAGVNAASRGDTVNILAGTYSIDAAIPAKTDIVIKGAGNNQTVIKTDSFNDIASDANPAMINIAGVSDVTITGITFMGPATSKQNQHAYGGTTSIGGLREARNGIKIQDASNIKISDCYFTLLLSDGIRISNSKNIGIDGCKFESAGHDSISEYKSSSIKVSNCTFDLMINTCIRFYNVEDCSAIKSTFIQNYAGTGAGYLEFEGSVKNVAINHNVFLKSSDPVVFRVGAACGNVVINDNILYHCSGISGGSGITTNNNIVASAQANWAAQGYGYNSTAQKMISLDEARSSSSDDDEEDEEEKAEEENCTNCSEDDAEEIIQDSNCSDETNCIPGNCTDCTPTNSSTVMNFIASLTIKYLDFSAGQAETAAFAANSSTQDLKAAEILLNNTTAEEQELGQKYLESGQLKLQFARDMLNLSQEGLDAARQHTNNTSCINGEC